MNTLELTDEEVNLIFLLLQEQPWKITNRLILKIEKQIKEQKDKEKK
jgi:hypothetical protein